MLTALHCCAALALAAAEPSPPSTVEYLGVTVLLRCEGGCQDELVWIKRARFNALREQAGLDRSCDAPGMTLRVVTGQGALCAGVPVFALAELTLIDDDVAGEFEQFVANDCLLYAVDGTCP